MAGKSRIFCLIIVLALFAATASADGISGTKSFFWKVTSRAGTAYLLGSIHLAREEMYPLPKKFDEAFARSATLVLEADINAADPVRLQQMVLGKGVYQGEETVENHISTATFQLLRRHVELNGLAVDQFAKLKPWLLATTLGVLELRKLGFDIEYGVDRHFAAKAAGKKRIVELESLASQFDLLNSFSPKEQELFLFHTLNEIEGLESVMDELISAWQNGDTGSMELYLKKGLNDHPEFAGIFEKLYTRRNREMAGKIEQYLKTGATHFVVVGSMHLVGKEGIVELLKSRGYKVEQL